MADSSGGRTRETSQRSFKEATRAGRGRTQIYDDTEAERDEELVTDEKLKWRRMEKMLRQRGRRRKLEPEREKGWRLTESPVHYGIDP